MAGAKAGSGNTRGRAQALPPFTWKETIMDSLLVLLVVAWPLIFLALLLAVGFWLWKVFLRTTIRVVRQELGRENHRSAPRPPPPDTPAPDDRCLITPTLALVLLTGVVLALPVLLLAYAWIAAALPH
jgi:hypothetical protein